MRRELIGFLIGLALIVGLVAPAFAGGGPGLNTWIGNGPFATGLGNRVITALAASPDGTTLYAGTGSGTVFVYVIDTDDDGLADNVDNCPAVANFDQTDTDADLLGDACDPNDDNDAFTDLVDNCPLVVNSDQANSDGDGLGNACDICPNDANNDFDTDGVCGNVDNCPLIANADQVNSDTDSLGDACDSDDDNDGITDGVDVCPLDATNDVDSDGVCGLVDNCPAVANADQADSDGDGFGNVCDMELTVSPGTMATDDQGVVQLTVTPVPMGATLTVEQLLDVNNNGVVEANEPAVRSFMVTDGLASANPDVLDDSDGVANGTIAVVLNLRDDRDLHHLPGKFLFWVSDGARAISKPFEVTPLLGSQSVSGTVTDGGAPVGGALVTLRGKGFTAVALGAFADQNGEYRVEVPTAGSYHVIAEDLAGQRVTAEADGDALVPVGAGQHVTGVNRTLPAGAFTISGDGGAPGVKVTAGNGAVHAQVVANADGSYQLSVPAGSYQVRVEPGSDLGLHPSSKGLVGPEAFSQTANATANVSGVNFTLTPATTSVTGTVQDEGGAPLAGMAVAAVNTADPVRPVAMAVTAADGTYTLGLNAGNAWSLAVVGSKLWPQDLLSSHIDNFNTATSPVAGNGLTVYAANAWIIGTVKDALNQPLARVEIQGWTADGALRTGGMTDMDGTYRLPARGGQSWTVDALTENVERGPVAAKSVVLGLAETATLDFGAANLTCAPPASLAVPAADADGAFAISWGPSPTAGVTYEVQEATDSLFSAGVRTFSVGALTTTITGRSQDTTYYYRVRAKKAGYTNSAWRYTGNSCAVPGIATAGVPASLAVPASDADGAYPVSWGVSATVGVTYELDEATNGTFTSGRRIVYVGTGTTANITGRSQNVTYYYRVRAVKGGLKESGYRLGANGCAITTASGMEPPVSLSVPLAAADGTYDVSWGASPTAGVAYELQEATNNMFTAGLRTVYPGPALTTTIAGRSQNVTYYYRVRAVKSGLSPSAWRYTGNSCAVPGTATAGMPTSLTVPVADGDGTYPVSWGASGTTGVTYELIEATNSTFTSGYWVAYVGTATTVTITGRSQNVTYYYQVRAVKGGLKDSGYRVAANSCAVPGTNTVAPPASLTVPAADADGAYTISWGASATVGVTYELQEATNSAFTSGLRTAYRGSALSCAIAGRSQDATYYYRVRAVLAGYKDSAYRYQWISCAVPGTSTAGMPASLTVPVVDADGTYPVSWAASATAGVTYELIEATNDTFTIGYRVAYIGTGTTANIAGRSQSVTYYYRVRAVKGGLVDSAYRIGGNGCAVGP